MRHFVATTAALLLASSFVAKALASADPDQTVRSADEVLHESMAMPVTQIPAGLLVEAQGVAIIPDVIKIGFVAGLRRGHGVVMVRDSNGAWTLPQFITLTGGSFGWQAGVQGTDVILVFMTKKSVDGLLRGKFTVGADAAAAAGPVGRNAAAATDARLKAEILSYSRSRGLFVGLSLDGSAIEIDSNAHASYYGGATAQIPESATRLHQDLVQLTSAGRFDAPLPGVSTPALSGRQTSTATEIPTPASGATTVRKALADSAGQLFSKVDESWRRYLTLPQQVFEDGEPPRPEALQASLRQYDRVAQESKYKTLIELEEFRATHELLKQYMRELSEPTRRQLVLPPPPRK